MRQILNFLATNTTFVEKSTRVKMNISVKHEGGLLVVWGCLSYKDTGNVVWKDECSTLSDDTEVCRKYEKKMFSYLSD